MSQVVFKGSDGKDIPVKENLIDRVVGYFNPVRGVERLRARAVSAVLGGYVGARRDRRQTKNWPTSAADADSVINPDLPALRDRSRDLVRNEPLASGAISKTVTNVVGSGLVLDPSIDREVLNMSNEEAAKWEAAVKREWRLWAESYECHMERTLKFGPMQELAFRSVLEGGDLFVNMPYKKRKGSPYGLKLQLIEADRVCNEKNNRDSATLSEGVEKDSDGAPARYHVLKQHPGNLRNGAQREWVKLQAFSKSGRRNVLHLFRPLRPGQSRGVPNLAPVIEPLKMAGRYTEAELMAAVVSSMFTVFIKTETGAVPAPMTPSEGASSTNSNEEYKLGVGAMIALGDNESIDTANPNRPNTAFDPFMMSIIRQIGVALEIPYELLIGHFTASYSASRAAINEAWKFFKGRRKWLVDEFCQLVYERWLEEAVAEGRILAPGFFDSPILRQAYCGAKWTGPSRGMIDEKKEAEAAILRLGSGITTLEEETSQLTGGSWEVNHPQSVKEHEAREEAGLKQSKVSQPAKDEDDDTDTDDEEAAA